MSPQQSRRTEGKGTESRGMARQGTSLLLTLPSPAPRWTLLSSSSSCRSHGARKSKQR